MRSITAALALPLLAACQPATGPVAAPAPLPVPAGCTVDPATRAAIGALPLPDVIAGAASYGLSTTDVLRLFALRDGTGTAADLLYAQACYGLTL